MLLDKKDNAFHVKLGEMGGQANQQIIYKPTWFYQHLRMVEHRISQQHVVSELNPTYQGRNEKHLLTIRGENACAIMRGIHTRQEGDDLLIVGVIASIGPHFQTLEAMMQADPEGSSWEFRLRCLMDATKDDGTKTLIPSVEKVITWDLFMT